MWPELVNHKIKLSLSFNVLGKSIQITPNPKIQKTPAHGSLFSRVAMQKRDVRIFFR
jgi:hypothetical protein